MENKINRITDILRRDDGISGAMMYTEQISWILFLKYLNDYEEAKHDEALLDGKEYTYILDEKYRWNNWACPQKDGKLDKINAKSGDDLLLFVNGSRDSEGLGLFDYLRNFKSINEDVKSVRYKIGAIFEFLDNRIANGHTLREVLDLIDEMNFHSQADLFQLSLIYEKLLKDMGSDGGNSGEFYTPRPLMKMKQEANGATQKFVGLTYLRSFPVPQIPPVEQKRIVQKLDALFERIDNAIALLQKNIDSADNFMNSVLNDVFSDLEQNYGTQSILDGINIGARIGYKPRLIDGKVPFIGMSDIDDKSGINTRYILEDYEKVSKGKVKFEKNAVLVGKITPCTQNNKTTIVPPEIDGGFATTEVYALHSKKNMYPFYLNYFMRSKKVNDYLVSTMVGATGRQRVPSESIRALNIAIPPMFIQDKVVLYFDNISAQIEQVKSSQRQKMQNLLDLKLSILDQAFHGKL